MIADIAIGHHAGADVLFLIAAILAGLAAIIAALGVRPRRVATDDAALVPALRWVPLLGWAAVTCLAVAWLIL